uniref:Uncharacterized protein n=1 Tax=Brassica oleracea var. oleracea TaxID=109376 RepID=A0A0D3CXJ3_BRAOL
MSYDVKRLQHNLRRELRKLKTVERPNSLSGEYSGFSTSEECGEHRVNKKSCVVSRLIRFHTEIDCLRLDCDLSYIEACGKPIESSTSGIRAVNVKGRRKRRLLEVDEDDVGSGGKNVHGGRSNRICWFVVCETTCRSKVIYVETRVIVWMIKARVWCQIVFWSGRLWKKYAVLFQKIEKMAVGGTYESQDSSERKLQRSMTVRSAGSVTRVKDQTLVDMRSSGSDDQSYQKIRNRAEVVLRGFSLRIEGCYKLKSAGMSQVMVAHVFRNSSPRPVEVSETRRWSLASTSVVVHIFRCFFGFRGSSATGSDGFLKSSQLLMPSGEESQVQCLQENLKCSDFKAESERNTVSGWSYFSAKNLVKIDEYQSELWHKSNGIGKGSRVESTHNKVELWGMI